ncbi:hypothetical protein [Tissierella carlieri]|uniref:hypothetical protein n=1 Tax=Tissierella carlieri TaxID=689904 RepID=UPI0038699130
MLSVVLMIAATTTVSAKEVLSNGNIIDGKESRETRYILTNDAGNILKVHFIIKIKVNR